MKTFLTKEGKTKLQEELNELKQAIEDHHEPLPEDHAVRHAPDMNTSGVHQGQASTPAATSAAARTVATNAPARARAPQPVAVKGKATVKATSPRSLASSKAMDEFHGRLAGIKQTVDQLNHRLSDFEAQLEKDRRDRARSLREKQFERFQAQHETHVVMADAVIQHDHHAGDCAFAFRHVALGARVRAQKIAHHDLARKLEDMGLFLVRGEIPEQRDKYVLVAHARAADREGGGHTATAALMWGWA